MARLTKDDLPTRVLSGIRPAGWNVVFVNQRHPYDLSIFRDEQSYRVRLYVWKVTHGGGAERPTTEYRIQITAVEIPLVAPVGFKTLLFGWYEDRGVIAAFDPERHRNPSASSPSIQISLETLTEASDRGLAVQERGNEEIAIAFRPELLVTYVENQQALHAFAGDRADIDLLIQAGMGNQPNDEALANTSPERQRVVRMVAMRRREATFRQRVLLAYGHACAVCHLQLELVEGTHIVPVGVPGSTDETSNGLALCPLHHDAYDDGLIGVSREYRVILAEGEFERLRREGRGGEEGSFRANLKQTIIVPTVAADCPRPEYLERGLQVRGWAA